MADKEFVKGFKVKEHTFNDGNKIYKCSVKVEEFGLNKANDKGWFNFDIKQSKNGNWYAEVNNFKPKGEGEIVKFAEDELPF